MANRRFEICWGVVMVGKLKIETSGEQRASRAAALLLGFTSDCSMTIQLKNKKKLLQLPIIKSYSQHDVLSDLSENNLSLSLVTEPIPHHHHSLSAHLLLKGRNVPGTPSWQAALSGQFAAGGLTTELNLQRLDL